MPDTAPEHDVEHLADLIAATTRVKVGTVTGTLTGFRSGQQLDMTDDDGQPFAMPWGSEIIMIEKIDKDRLARAREAQAAEHAVAVAAKRAVFNSPDYPSMTGEQVAEAVRAEIERRTVQP